MAKITNTGRELVYNTRISVSDAIKDAERLKDAFRKIKEEAAKVVSSMPSIKLTSSGLDTKPLTAYQQKQIELKATLLQGQLASQKLRDENIALSNSYKQGQITAQELSAKERQLNKDRRDLADATRAARIAQVAATGSYDEANARLKELGRSIKAAEGGFKSTSPAIKAQVNEYNTLNDALKRFDAQMGNHQRNIGNYKSAIQGVIGDLRSMALAYLSVQGALTLATKSFDVNRQSQAVEASLKFTLGGAEAATDKINELRKNALLLGQDFLPVAESYSKFAGAARAANFPLSETDRIFKAISVAGARFNLTSDQISGALLAIQQMISKGTVQSEELRGQLGERLPGAFAIAAKAMGVTEQKLGKLLQTGQVLAADLLPKLATQLESDFGLKAGEHIDNLNSSMGRLSTTVDTALKSDGFGRFAKGVVDATTNIVSAIDKLMGSRSVKEFFARFFSYKTGDGPDDMAGLNSGNKFDKINSIEDLMKSSSASRKGFNPIGASAQVMVSTLAEKPLEELEQLRKKYLTAATEAANAVNIYRKGISSGLLLDGGKNSLKEVEDNFKRTTNVLAQVNSAYDMVADKAAKTAKSTKDLTDDQLTSIAAIRKRITELSKLDDSAVDGSDINKRIDALKARLGGVKKTVDTELNARNSLQKKIEELQRGAVINSQDADQKEVDSVKEKYVQIRAEVDKFYTDQKKKGSVKYKVDISGLNAAEKAETTAVTYKQDAKKQLESLDLQKKQYADYQEYLNEFGSEMAQKRFGKEVIDNKTYLKKLQDEAAKISSVPVGERTGGQKDQLTELNKRIAVEIDAERGKYDTLLRQLQSYQSQAKALAENYANDQAELAKNPLNLSANDLAEQLKLLKENFDKSLSSLSVKELTDSVDWSNLFSNLDDLATSDIDALVTSIESRFKELSKTYTPIDLAEIRRKLLEAKDILIKDNPFRQLGIAIKVIFSEGADSAKKSASEIKVDWNNLGRATEGAFSFVIDAIESCDILKDAIGEVGMTALSSLSAVAKAGIATATAVSAASAASSATATAASAAIKAAEKASVILAVISLALVVVQAIASVIGSIFNAGDKRIEKKIQGYQQQLDALDKGFKQLERDVQQSVGESFYSSSLKEIENLNQQQALLQQQLDAERSKKHADDEKITAYQDKLDEIPTKIADIQQSITDMLVQTSFKDLSSSLADAFTEGFSKGEDALTSLNEKFNDVIANAVKKGLELKFLQPVVDSFIKDFADYMKNNGNSALGFDFESYKTILAQAGEKFQEGLDPFKQYLESPDNANNMSAAANEVTPISERDALKFENYTMGIRIIFTTK